jgi:N-methylhydantoinase B
VKIQVTLTVDGDTLLADFSGTDEQVRGAINCTLSFAASGVGMCVRAVMREKIPNNSGMFRPIKVTAPVGTVINVQMPGASSMRGVTGFRICDVVFGALAGLLESRVMAAGEGGNTLVIIGGRRDQDRSRFVFFELLSGTWGGRPDRDGNDGLSNPANVASNIPIEQAECEYPVLIERYGLVRDSGGAGQFRGGMAIERQWRLLTSEAANLSIRSDRRDHPPWGLNGGRPGTGSINVLRHADGSEEILGVMLSCSMGAGETLYHRQPGGGGYGDPLRRDPDSVARDLRDDRVSLEAARQQYGVVFSNAAAAVVDHGATEALRRKMRQGDAR